MNNLVNITDEAASELKSLLKSEEKEDHALRIFIAGMGCSGIQYGLALDNEIKEEDVTEESNGLKVVMSSDIEEGLADATIDYVETDEGKGFVIDNPNPASCGSCSSCH